MRIISGKYRSRRIYTSAPVKGTDAESDGFRPTTDRAKETLFNVLNNILDFDEITCLDLFAGSGSLGFESISRGAAKCDYVETSPMQSALITKTAEELGCEKQIHIYNEDVMKFLKRSSGLQYDVIFADPPFDYEYYTELINEVMQLKFSVFVLEHSSAANLMHSVSDYDIIEKTIGAVGFKIFVSKEDN